MKIAPFAGCPLAATVMATTTLVATPGAVHARQRTGDLTIRPAPPTRITVNGKTVETDQRPLLVRDDRRPAGGASLGTQILVPIRFVVEALGATVYWDPKARTAVVVRGANNIALRVGGDTHTVNGLAMTTRAPVRVVGGRTMVPVRFISNALGAEVRWDSRARTVAITLPEAPGAAASSGLP